MAGLWPCELDNCARAQVKKGRIDHSQEMSLNNINNQLMLPVQKCLRTAQLKSINVIKNCRDFVFVSLRTEGESGGISIPTFSGIESGSFLLVV